MAGPEVAHIVCLLPATPVAYEVRSLIRSGAVGRVVFCRASRKTADWLAFVLDGAPPACERIEQDELVLCGTEATLVVDGRDYRRFA